MNQDFYQFKAKSLQGKEIGISPTTKPEAIDRFLDKLLNQA